MFRWGWIQDQDWEKATCDSVALQAEWTGGLPPKQKLRMRFGGHERLGEKYLSLELALLKRALSELFAAGSISTWGRTLRRRRCGMCWRLL